MENSSDVKENRHHPDVKYIVRCVDLFCALCFRYQGAVLLMYRLRGKLVIIQTNKLRPNLPKYTPTPTRAPSKKQWFFKGGSTQNQWVSMDDFSKGGGVHKTDGFEWMMEFVLLLLKIKRPGCLFKQKRYLRLMVMNNAIFANFPMRVTWPWYLIYSKGRYWFVFWLFQLVNSNFQIFKF